MGADYPEDASEFPELFFGSEADVVGNPRVCYEPTSWRDTPGALVEDCGQLEKIDYSVNYVLDLYFKKLDLELLDKKALSLARGFYAEFTSKHSGVFFFDDDPELDLSEVIDSVKHFSESLPLLPKD